ncbi:hypothetical protein [uncultured Corynebacterium sp.]|uniref:hypothetical protein n=1 Tax=uncultured Corynebacterium sp. TaxID=159447 RepID=UPI0025D37E85|nr:hypothetical protein [uncultured Corynebacterium sp.]
MGRHKLLHVITERVNCEPRGITVESNIMQFEWILGEIFTHKIDTNDPFRGLGQALTWVFHWNSTPPNTDVSGELLEVESDEYLTLDYARGEVTLQLDGTPKMRCALTPEAVYPLFKTVWDHTEPDPYGETPKFPKRSLVRLVCERSGAVSSGIDVFYPIGGEDRIRRFLPGILLCQTVDSLLSDLWLVGELDALVQPFQDQVIGDEYAATTPPPREVDCPMLTVDVPNKSLRLSSTDGELIMVTDFTDEAIERVLAEFERLVDPWAQPRALASSHPDYELWAGDSPF